MSRAHKVFLATGYPQSELIGTMNRLLACLALGGEVSFLLQPLDDFVNGLAVRHLVETLRG